MNDNQELRTENDPLEHYIDGTLRRDAESLRTQFGTVPSDRLTTRLALRTATRGVFRSLGSKLAMYAGAAAIVAGAVYYFPHSGQQVPAPSPQTVLPQTTLPQAAPQMTSAQPVPAPIAHRATIESPISKARAAQPQTFPVPKASAKEPQAKALQPADTGTGTIPKVTDNHYHGPVK
ncbi:MAG TPA: hypothetical protein VGM92_15335 [Candidatus Kapabacteria bacterium]|jgi:hypothetical protein